MDTNDDVSLFEPTGRDMLFEYPELGKYPEFLELKARDLKLAWFIGNRTSPFVKAGYAPAKRIDAAIRTVYTEKALDRPEVKDMLKGVIPPHIMLAIQRMAVFSPSHRLRAKLGSEYIFEELLDMIYLTPEEKLLMKMDADLKKKHADLLIKVNSELPSIIQTIESGYGVGNKKDKKENKEGKVLTSVRNIRDRLQNS